MGSSNTTTSTGVANYQHLHPLTKYGLTKVYLDTNENKYLSIYHIIPLMTASTLLIVTKSFMTLDNEDKLLLLERELRNIQNFTFLNESSRIMEFDNPIELLMSNSCYKYIKDEILADKHLFNITDKDNAIRLIKLLFNNQTCFELTHRLQLLDTYEKDPNDYNYGEFTEPFNRYVIHNTLPSFKPLTYLQKFYTTETRTQVEMYQDLLKDGNLKDVFKVSCQGVKIASDDELDTVFKDHPNWKEVKEEVYNNNFED
jgi:hypothetical protein